MGGGEGEGGLVKELQRRLDEEVKKTEVFFFFFLERFFDFVF